MVLTIRTLTSGSLLARNTKLNLIGQAVPLLIGVATIPFVIRGLGTDRFGVFSFAWVVLGYFAVFDLGLGRATIKFVSEALGMGDQDQVPRVVWTAVTAEVLLGIAGAIVLAVITPLLVGRVLNVPQELLAEAKTTFYLLALSFPVVLTSSSFRGVLAAAQRFDLVNAVKIPTSCATYLLPLVGLALGFNLPGIVVLILLARVGGLAAFIMLSLSAIPGLKNYSASIAFFPRLFAFGGWVMVTSIVGPILVYVERFLIGSLLSLAALAFYSVPYEMMTRFTIIPTSLTMTLFPAFSALKGVQNRQRLATVFARSVKYVLLTLGPTVLVISLFAEVILRLWLGTDFARESTTVLQVLAIGVLINSLAYIPFSLLQGVGRPDLPAKFHLLEMPFYIAMAWLLVSQLGIAGAALAWTIRVTLDALLLFVAAFKSCRFPVGLLAKNGLTTMLFALLTLTGMVYAVKALTASLPLFVQAVIFFVLFGLFAWVVWRRVLDYLDKGVILGMTKRWKRSERTT